KLAAVDRLKSVQDGRYRFLLMGPRNFFRLQADKIRASQAKLIPVNRAFRKVGQAYPRNRNGLPFNRILCVPVPFVGGGNNNASRELPATIIGCELLPRRREERINVWFLNCVAWIKKLALYGPIITGRLFAGNKVNSVIRSFSVRPLLPKPDVFQ